MIRDLEQLLLSVTEDTIRDYMREAVRAYSAGAYRAAVVIAIAAGMDGLRDKLALLASNGGASPDLKNASREIAQTFNEQKAFETNLIEAAEIHASLISPAEARKLKLLLNTRHLCAHPSGHQGSAEEAREAISSIVDLVLSRPPLMGIAGIDTLLSRISAPIFFPDRTNRTSIQEVLTAELRIINPDLYSALVTKGFIRLVEVIKRDASAPRRFPTSPPPSSDEQKNLVLFLCGCLHQSEQLRKKVWQRAAELLEQEATYNAALEILSSDPLGLRSAESITRDRYVSLVRRLVPQIGYPYFQLVNVIKTWLNTQDFLDQATQEDLVRTIRACFIDQIKTNSASIIASLENHVLEQAFFEKAIEDARNSDFSISNMAIAVIQSMLPEQASRVPSALRARYIVNVCSVGFGTYPAFEAVPLVTAGFRARADWMDDIMKILESEPDYVEKSIRNVEYFVNSLISNSREDIAKKVLDSIFNQESVTKDQYYSILPLSKSTNAAVAECVNAIIAKHPLPS